MAYTYIFFIKDAWSNCFEDVYKTTECIWSDQLMNKRTCLVLTGNCNSSRRVNKGHRLANQGNLSLAILLIPRNLYQTVKKHFFVSFTSWNELTKVVVDVVVVVVGGVVGVWVRVVVVVLGKEEVVVVVVVLFPSLGNRTETYLNPPSSYIYRLTLT